MVVSWRHRQYIGWCFDAKVTFFVIFAFFIEVVPFFVLFFGYKSTMVDFELDIPKWFYII